MIGDLSLTADGSDEPFARVATCWQTLELLPDSLLPLFLDKGKPVERPGRKAKGRIRFVGYGSLVAERSRPARDSRAWLDN